MYVEIKKGLGDERLAEIYNEFYRLEPFIRFFLPDAFLRPRRSVALTIAPLDLDMIRAWAVLL